MQKQTPLSGAADADTEALRQAFADSFDLVVRRFNINGKNAAAVFFDGMCDEMKMTESIIKPLTDDENFPLFARTENAIKNKAFKGLGMKEAPTLEETVKAVTDGNMALLTDGCAAAFIFSVQGYPKKSVTAPQTEQNEFGSGESFVDCLKDNAALLRRRLKTPALVLRHTEIGSTSRTGVLLCYLDDRADKAALNEVQRRLAATGLDTLLGSGYLRAFLNTRKVSLFSDAGFTERPDMLAAKLAEGRIGILTDGSPFALIVPYLFIDYFHSIDDYMCSAAYALFIRLLRLACFFLSAALPGLFVATCNFHPEVLPPNVMLDIAAAEAKTPFSLVFEAVAIHLIYEIVREAGLRMPAAVGHAVSIVGALVVGDAAVTAGLIAAPMLMVVAITAVSSAVNAKLHESVALMRFGMILLGGATGFFGIFLAFGFLLGALCAPSAYGIPFSAPFSPFVKKAQTDALLRADWRVLARKNAGAKELKRP